MKNKNNITDNQFTIALIFLVLWVFAGGIAFTMFVINEGGLFLSLWFLITVIGFLLWKLENIESPIINHLKQLLYSPLFNV